MHENCPSLWESLNEKCWNLSNDSINKILQFIFLLKWLCVKQITVLSFRASAHEAHGHCSWLLTRRGPHLFLSFYSPTQNSVPLSSSWRVVLSPLFRKGNLEYFFFQTALLLMTVRCPVLQALTDSPTEPSETGIRHVVTAGKLSISWLSGLSLPWCWKSF